MKLLFDTHAALWLVHGDARLSERALARIRGSNRNELLVSDMLLLELEADLVTRDAAITESGLVPVVW